MRSFLDTNILLYAGSNARKDASKKEAASALVAPLDFCISTQVIQEYLSNALGKKDLGISEAQIETTLTCLADVPVQAVTYSLIVKAWQLRSRFKVSHWDATILAAALELGCHTLYSEDFNHGQDYGGVIVVNPLERIKIFGPIFPAGKASRNTTKARAPRTESKSLSSSSLV